MLAMVDPDLCKFVGEKYDLLKQRETMRPIRPLYALSAQPSNNQPRPPLHPPSHVLRPSCFFSLKWRVMIWPILFQANLLGATPGFNDVGLS